MDEVYASLAYDGALLLRVPVCVSRAVLVYVARAVVLNLVNFVIHPFRLSICLSRIVS